MVFRIQGRKVGAVRRVALLSVLLLLFGFGTLVAEVSSCKAFCDSSKENCPYEDIGELEDTYIVNRFIRAVTARDRAALAEIISFPIERNYPLPSIRTKEEFLANFEEVIGEEFTKTIAESDQYDCGRRRWRPLSILRNDGRAPLVWFDDYGNVGRIWHETEIARRKRIRLVEIERNQLHPSLREYVYPVLEWETCTYRIRIDDLGSSFRYASWRVNRLHNSKPDIVMNNGEDIVEGTIGNRYFLFQNGEYKYLVYAGNPYSHSSGRLQGFRTDVEPLLDETGDRRTTIYNWYFHVREVAQRLHDETPLLDEPFVNFEDRGALTNAYRRVSSCVDRER